MNLRMNHTAQQKVIVIGGISGGIGSSLAQLCRASGYTVVGFSRTSSEAIDATNSSALEDYIANIHAEQGRIDGYVHAIGSIFLKPAHLTRDEDWIQTIQTNLSSAFYALRACTKRMQKQGSGSCLFFSTTAAQIGIANHEAIAAAKGGIEAMVRSAAATYAPRGLRINAIAPSLTDTPLAQPLIGSPQGLEISKRMHPLGDIMHAEQVASLAHWLLSDAAASVTGQTFVMDGGLSSIAPKPRA